MEDKTNIGQAMCVANTLVEEALGLLRNTYPNQYILYLSRPSLNETTDVRFKIIIDSLMPHRNDSSRENFYIQYLNKRYKKVGFEYEGEDGVYDLNVEMLIYMQIWEAHLFISDLYQLSRLLTGKEFNWQYRVPNKIENAIDEIVSNFKDAKCDALAEFISRAYNKHIRNSIAHAQCLILPDQKRIELYNRSCVEDEDKEKSFEEFQKCFLWSIALNYELEHAIEAHRLDVCNNQYKTDYMDAPGDEKIRIECRMNCYGKSQYPSFYGYRMSKKESDSSKLE